MNIVSLLEYPQYIPQVAAWNWRAFCKEERPSVTQAAVERKLRAQRPDALPQTYLALQDGAPVGTATLYDNDLAGDAATPWLGSLFVPEAMRGQGIAQTLIAHVKAMARARGFQTLYLRTEHTAAYYEARGWEFVRRTVDPAYGMETTVYQTPLSGFRVLPAEGDRWGSVRLFDDAAGSMATIAPLRGGICTQFFAAGREVMYLDRATLDDPEKRVRGGCPILFPSCGRLRDAKYALAGGEYAMEIHGFARKLPWRVVESRTRGAAELTIELSDNAVTRAEYPFAFAARFTYRLCGATLSIEQTIENRAAQRMPFSLGLHPYFRVDPARSRAILHARRYLAVSEGMREHDYDGVTEFSGDADLIATELSGLRATVETGLGHQILMAAEGAYRYYVIWSPEGTEFACVEPWTALPDALNTGRDLLWLAPGEKRGFCAAFTVQAR